MDPLEPPVQCLSPYAERLRGPFLVSTQSPESRQQIGLFHIFKFLSDRQNDSLRRPPVSAPFSQNEVHILFHDHTASHPDDNLLHQSPQLSDISRPGVGCQPLESSRVHDGEWMTKEPAGV